jgi:hypothetical protein
MVRTEVKISMKKKLWHFVCCCFFSDLYFPPKNSGENIRSASGFFIAGIPFVKDRHIAHLGWETPVFFTLFTLSTYGTVVSNCFLDTYRIAHVRISVGTSIFSKKFRRE